MLRYRHPGGALEFWYNILCLVEETYPKPKIIGEVIRWIPGQEHKIMDGRIILIQMKSVLESLCHTVIPVCQNIVCVYMCVYMHVICTCIYIYTVYEQIVYSIYNHTYT